MPLLDKAKVLRREQTTAEEAVCRTKEADEVARKQRNAELETARHQQQQQL